SVYLGLDIPRLHKANVEKRVGGRAVRIDRAELDPKWQHECLTRVESDVNMTGRAVSRSVRKGHEDGMRGNDGIAVSINRDGDYAEGPPLINLIPTGKGSPERMRVAVHSCKYRGCHPQAK